MPTLGLAKAGMQKVSLLPRNICDNRAVLNFCTYVSSVWKGCQFYMFFLKESRLGRQLLPCSLSFFMVSEGEPPESDSKCLLTNRLGGYRQPLPSRVSAHEFAPFLVIFVFLDPPLQIGVGGHFSYFSMSASNFCFRRIFATFSMSARVYRPFVCTRAATASFGRAGDT